MTSLCSFIGSAAGDFTAALLHCLTGPASVSAKTGVMHLWLSIALR